MLDSLKKRVIALAVIIAALIGAIAIGMVMDLNRPPKEPVVYQYMYGTTGLFSTYAHDQYLMDSYCYSDEWFLDDAAVENKELALTSMQLVAASVEDGDSWGKDMLKHVGFEETGAVGYDGSNPDGFNYTWGTKTIGSGSDQYKLVAIVVQSYSVDKSIRRDAWRQNFRVNGEEITDEHYALSRAVDSMFDEILKLGGSGKVKYWVMGHSRAGAVANILSARLNDKINRKGDRVYAYTFEAPNVVAKSAVPDNETRYACIHNYFCSDDIVTIVPPWDMTLYGVSHRLNTEEVSEKFPDSLKRLGSEAYIELEEGPGIPSDRASQIVDLIGETVYSREDYSAEHVDEFTDNEGNDVTMKYVYQDILIKFMDDVFGDSNNDIDTGLLAENMRELVPAIRKLATGVKDGSNADILEASRMIRAFMDKYGIVTVLDETEMYGFLKLVAPAITDPDAVLNVQEGDREAEEEILSVVMTKIAGVKRFTLPHQFDATIANLKVYAANNEHDFRSYNVTADAPAAGADVRETAVALVDATVVPDVAGRSYVNSEAAYITEDETFEDNKVYYLEYTINVIGHQVPDDFRMTVNGSEPIKPLEISYSDGFYTVQGIYRFTVGTPQEKTVSFDIGPYGTSPEPFTLPYGSILGYEAEAPALEVAEDDEGKWMAGGWRLGSTAWDDIVVNSDLTIRTSWNHLVDNIDFNIEIPAAGETLKAPTVADGAPYYIDDYYMMDRTWDDIDTYEEGDPFIINVKVRLNDDAVPYCEWTDPEYADYIGTYSINGEVREVDYVTLGVSFDYAEGSFSFDLMYGLD